MADLRQLGWDDDWARSLASSPAGHREPGRIALEDKHAFIVLTRDGEATARLAGRFFRDRPAAGNLPHVGDWVALCQKPGESRAVIEAVLPRRTSLTRKIPGREAVPQVLAANIDIAFIVQALDSTLNLRRLERFLVMTHEGGARAVVVLNKADLAPAQDPRVDEVRACVGPAPVLRCSARMGMGLPLLREFIQEGRTSVFVGTSGVGKSSLINGLYGEEIQATLDVREQDGKGRHSTTWRELIVLPGGGVVIDTPGMREFHLWAADGGLDEAFPDIAALATQCHFRACSHTTEKRCAVQAALADGTLTPDRLANFQKLRRELDYLAKERLEHTYLSQRRTSRIRRRLDEADWESD